MTVNVIKESEKKKKRKIVETDVNSIPLTHIYMTADFLDLVQALQIKSGGIKLVFDGKFSLYYYCLSYLLKSTTVTIFN